MLGMQQDLMTGLEPSSGVRDARIKIHGPEAFDGLRRGRIPVKAKRLVDVTYEAMMHGIAVVLPGIRIGAIGDAIQRYAESHRYSVVRDFCGHGVGRVFHDAPSILHYGHPDEGPALREGMFFPVEPMINAGRR